MTAFTSLTERQQKALCGASADRGTRKALARMGLAEFDDVSGYQPARQLDALRNAGCVVCVAGQAHER